MTSFPWKSALGGLSYRRTVERLSESRNSKWGCRCRSSRSIARRCQWRDGSPSWCGCRSGCLPRIQAQCRIKPEFALLFWWDHGVEQVMREIEVLMADRKLVILRRKIRLLSSLVLNRCVSLTNCPIRESKSCKIEFREGQDYRVTH